MTKEFEQTIDYCPSCPKVSGGFCKAFIGGRRQFFQPLLQQNGSGRKYGDPAIREGSINNCPDRKAS